MADRGHLRARGLSKVFGEVEALRGVDLELAEGGYACVMGVSGSGKSTLLRILAGLERADRGSLEIAGERVDELPPERRPTRTVFQTPALFPQLTVIDNVAFAARLQGRRRARKAARTRAGELLARLGLDPARFSERRPEELSGGERQRVALARALFETPRWLLLDEPLAALDRPRRADLRRTLASLCRDEGVSVLHVTHEAEEALALADHLIVLADGRVLAEGAPAELYARPPDLHTARLLGELSPVPGELGEAWLRPERLRVVPADDREARAPAELLRQACAGPHWELELALDDGDRTRVLALRSEPWPDLSESGAGRRCALSWADEDRIELE